MLALLPSAGEIEARRVQAHLFGAEVQVRARSVDGLSSAQRENRAINIDRLGAYRTAGRFPKNRDFPTRRVPYFRDADGTLCAMAWLLWESGEHALVEHVVATRNNATVFELADEPGLAAWLDRNGLSLEEAARIQPHYGDPFALNMVTPSYQVRLGSCSPPVTVQVRAGSDLITRTATVESSSEVEFFGDASCRTLLVRKPYLSMESKFQVTNGVGTFYFLPAAEGVIDLQMFVGGDLEHVPIAQQHEAFAIDGGYRVPLLADESFAAAKSGCSASPGSALSMGALVLGALVSRRFRKGSRSRFRDLHSP